LHQRCFKGIGNTPKLTLAQRRQDISLIFKIALGRGATAAQISSQSP